MTLIPMVTLFVQDEQTRNRRAQVIIRESFRIYIAMLRALGVLKLEVIGAEKLSACQGKLIISNHPTLIDIVLLMALLPDAKCVVKPALFANPFLRQIVRAAGYIRNDVEPEILIEKCRETLLPAITSLSFRKARVRCPASRCTFSADSRISRP